MFPLPISPRHTEAIKARSLLMPPETRVTYSIAGGADSRMTENITPTLHRATSPTRSAPISQRSASAVTIWWRHFDGEDNNFLLRFRPAVPVCTALAFPYTEREWTSLSLPPASKTARPCAPLLPSKAALFCEVYSIPTRSPEFGNASIF